MIRMRARVALLLLASGAASPAAAQNAAAERCILEFESPTGTTRTNLVSLPSGKYNAYQGNGVVYRCKGQDNQLRADSAEYYGDPGILYMIGRVHYTEPRVTADAQRMTYFQADDRLLAEGNVVAVMQGGTTMRGPRVEYWRVVPGRPRARMFAPGRPRMELIERDSAGRPQEPVNVVANTITMEGDSLVYAGGKVEITRPDLLAKGDSAFLDSGREFARLMRRPSVESKGERPFTLVGGTIDVFSRARKVERVLSKASAVATSEDMRLASDTIDLRVRQNQLERAYAWGPSRARVTSPDRDLQADSLDVIMPGQRLRELRALRGAYVESVVDTTRVRSAERDWMRGDTIIARFDTATATDTSRRPRPRDIVATGHASSFNQMASRRGIDAPPAINYVRGRVISAVFDSAEVRTVTVTDSAGGVYLEPGVDSSATARAARPGGDSAAAAGQGTTGTAPGAPPRQGVTTPGTPQPGQRKPRVTPRRPPAGSPTSELRP